jgi:hypothetical protein
MTTIADALDKAEELTLQEHDGAPCHECRMTLKLIRRLRKRLDASAVLSCVVEVQGRQILVPKPLNRSKGNDDAEKSH